MKNNFFRSIFLLCLGSVLTLQSAQSYNYNSHDGLTIKAVIHSQLEQYLPTIGLTSIDNEMTDLISPDLCVQDFVCGNTKTILGWFSHGARDEDVTVLKSTNTDDVNNIDLNIARYQHHFYDPINRGVD